MMFAQAAVASVQAGLGPIEIGLIVLASLFGALIVIGLPVWLGVNYARRERELQHTERMKALELGRSLPGDATPWTTAKAAGTAIGISVPISVTFIGLMASGAGAEAAAVWPAVGSIGVAAVICGTILATPKPSAPRPEDVDHFAKPIHDPDAYDVVGRRG
jgi:hypothetical protein